MTQLRKLQNSSPGAFDDLHGHDVDLDGLEKLVDAWRGREHMFRYGVDQKGGSLLPNPNYQLSITLLGEKMDAAIDYLWSVEAELAREEVRKIERDAVGQ